jgi:hypothetical protein
MTFMIPEAAIPYGFRLKPGGAHGSKSMMLPEVRLLFAASTPDSDYAELRRLVIEDNVVLKDTLSNRDEVFTRLRELYGLRQELRLYRVLRALWDTGEQEQPLLVILCALARDPLLRATAHTVLDQPTGAVVPTPSLETAIEVAFPQKYSPKTRLSISQNTGASWAQAGHLVGKVSKVRHTITAGPASAAYALLLGHLCGARGALLYETCWAQVLDAPVGALDSLAFAASQRGWVDYRRIGTVVEIGFSYLMSL